MSENSQKALTLKPTYVWKKCRILKSKWASVKFNERYSERLTEIEDTINEFSPPWVSTKPTFTFPELYTNENNQFLSSPSWVYSGP